MIDERTVIDFPFYQSQLYDLFGDPRDSSFEGEYLRIIDLREFAPALSHVLNYEGNPWNHRIYGNYVMREPLRRAFGFLVERGLAGELKTFDGCFCIRSMKSGRELSVHSWALAIDLNAARNRFGQAPTLSPEFVRCFADCGFEWGGLWRPNKYRDGMHFQLCWIKDRQGPLSPVPWVE